MSAIRINVKFPATKADWLTAKPINWKVETRIVIDPIAFISPMVWGDQIGIAVYLFGGSWYFTTDNIIFLDKEEGL